MTLAINDFHEVDLGGLSKTCAGEEHVAQRAVVAHVGLCLGLAKQRQKPLRL